MRVFDDTCQRVDWTPEETNERVRALDGRIRTASTNNRCGLIQSIACALGVSPQYVEQELDEEELYQLI